MSHSYDECKLRSDRDEYPDEEGDRPEPDQCGCDGNGWLPCYNCHGEGYFVTCIDDMCRGAGECMHGDGETACRNCGGEGEVRCSCNPADGRP